jgi:hypothetical protein
MITLSTESYINWLTKYMHKLYLYMFTCRSLNTTRGLHLKTLKAGQRVSVALQLNWILTL